MSPNIFLHESMHTQNIWYFPHTSCTTLTEPSGTFRHPSLHTLNTSLHTLNTLNALITSPNICVMKERATQRNANQVERKAVLQTFLFCCRCIITCVWDPLHPLSLFWLWKPFWMDSKHSKFNIQLIFICMLGWDMLGIKSNFKCAVKDHNKYCLEGQGCCMTDIL